VLCPTMSLETLGFKSFLIGMRRFSFDNSEFTEAVLLARLGAKVGLSS
jgi:hypothetical protein